MTKRSALESKRSKLQGLAGAATALGAAEALAPRSMAAAFRVPVSGRTPESMLLTRLFGAHTIALGLWGLTAGTEEEMDRGLAITGGISLLETLLALTYVGRGRASSALPVVAASAAFGATALAIRFRKG